MLHNSMKELFTCNFRIEQWKEVSCSTGRWSQCTIAISIGLHSFGSAPKLLAALESLPRGEATGDEGCSEITEWVITPFELFFGMRVVEEVTLGWLWEIAVAVGTVCWVFSSSSVFSSSTLTTSFVGKVDAGGWRLGSTLGTSFISQRGYLHWKGSFLS